MIVHINQIYHVIMNKKWKRSLLDVKVYRGADVFSDRYILFAKIKLELMAVASNKQRGKVCDINRLKSQEVRRNFRIELKNRFSVLATLEDETDQDSVECSWKRIKESYADVAKKAVGFKKKKTKKWLSAETWDRIEARRKAKVKMLNAKSSSQIERTQEEYKNKDREVCQ